MPANLENSVATGLEKSVFIPTAKKGNTKECSHYHTIVLISRASKVMLKILQARLQQSVNRELPDVQAEFRKGKGTKDQVTNILGSQKKQENSRKTFTSASLTTPLTVWITTNWKILRDGNTTLPTYRETCMQVKKQWLEPDMEQQTGSKLGKEYIKALYCHLAYLTYMQSTSCKMPGWMKLELESRLLGEISTTSDYIYAITLMVES